jgi:NAD-dependent SIR2 family protein deacetylase
MASERERDPRSEYVARLHTAYSRRRLNIFTGAGLSQQSGFPGWDALNKELVLRYLSKEIGTSTPAAMLASERLASKVDFLYEVLGRDAAADFVQQGMKRQFGTVLAQVLYGGRTLEDIPLKSAHHQIVALSDRARLFTLNFDPLLELALAKSFPKTNWRKFRSPNDDGHSLGRFNKVEHLHGWINTDGTMSRDVILTQSDYFDLSDDRRAFAKQSSEEHAHRR